MLAFARRQELKPTAVDLPTLVHGMSEMAQPTLGSRITIISRFPLSLPRVMVDAHQLELALLNLFVNARDAMPSGGGIEVRASPESVEPGHAPGLVPGRYVRLSVIDEGVGMSTDTLRGQSTERSRTTPLTKCAT